ncbi:MAG: DUF3017 domain-containing protein [Propionibacteriaceae bacterium]|nr:DUF3017 domain-containing protein [Propionibacteriaceae bacterium]
MTGPGTPLSEQPGLRGALRRQWPWVLVVALIGVGLALVTCHEWRAGLYVIGGAMLVGGVLRWTLPHPGILAVRSKAIDIPLYLALGSAIIVIDAIATIPL